MSWFPQVGDIVGRYRLTDVLGHGGMGVVFIAVPPDLDRPVALKILAPQAAADPAARERFAREAETLASLNSPHIVYLLEHGEQDGCPYLVTQLLPDGDLRRQLEKDGALTPRWAADVVAQVAAALEEAHAHGVVHRDLTAANVLLRRLPGGELHACLCDFGIARADSHATTAASAVVGTLEYLAPERQSGAPATVATDIYSLGCLLWAATTGAPPYRGHDVDVALAHLRAPVPQLPGSDPVTRRTNEILARAMAKQPGQRYATAGDMRRALLELGALAATHEKAAPTDDAPGRRRPRGWWIAIAAVSLAIVGGLTAAFWPSPEPVAERRCWDGSTDQPSDCPVPTGIHGLSWVYPSFAKDRETCRLIERPLSRQKLLVYFCPFGRDNPNEGIRYSQWASASIARQFISDDFRLSREGSFEQEGYTWSFWVRTSGDELGWFSSAIAYRDWPFSAEVVTNTQEASILGCTEIKLRSPETFETVTARCDP